MLETNSAWKLAHGFTYSGHHLARSRSGLHRGDRRRSLLEGAVLGERLRAGLQSLVDDGLYPGLRAPASCGRCTRPRAHTDRSAVDVLQGVIARPMSDVIGFCPPLVSTEAQVDQMVDALAAVV